MKRFFDPRNKNFSRVTALFGVLLFFVFGVFFVGHVVFAADPTSLDAVGAGAGLPQTSLPILIARIIRAVLGVLGIVTVLLVLYAGFMYMGAKGDMTKVDKAKKIITQAVIGLVIIFSSYSIASYVLSRLLAALNGPGTITSVAKKYVEPLAGSLGAGIIENHYPVRGATDVPRNTKIFVTFKEAIKPETIIDGFTADCTYTVADPQATPLCPQNLKVNAVQIFETAKGDATKLATDKVKVTVSEDHKTFVFKPTEYLGYTNKDANYTVALKPTIQKENGGAAFVGVNSAGYGWNFTVSTNIDLTPPRILSVVPLVSPLHAAGGATPTITGPLDRNITVEITFDEAMDPISSTGSYIPKVCSVSKKACGETNDPACPGTETCGNNTNPLFQNIVTTQDTTAVRGTYEISNGYTTVGFTTTDWCGKDPCGGDIYCLPGNKTITVLGKAASVDNTNPPQGIMNGVKYDGLVDAAGNSLDGNGDKNACQSASDTGVCKDVSKSDGYSWIFSTSDNVNVTVPKIESLTPDIGAGNIDVNAPITLTFNAQLKSSTINSTNVSLLADPYYSMWFVPKKTDPVATPIKSVITIEHPTFISAAECGVVSGTGNCEYWPVITQDVKSSYQICMFPAGGPTSDTTQATPACTGTDVTHPYCCNGEASASACPIPVKPAL